MGCCLSRNKSENKETTQNNIPDIYCTNEQLQLKYEENEFSGSRSHYKNDLEDDFSDSTVIIKSSKSKSKPRQQENSDFPSMRAFDLLSFKSFGKAMVNPVNPKDGSNSDTTSLLSSKKYSRRATLRCIQRSKNEANIENTISISLKLINFEFICSHFYEIFSMHFNPIFEIKFRNTIRKYHNLLKSNTQYISQPTIISNSKDRMNSSYINDSNLQNQSLYVDLMDKSKSFNSEIDKSILNKPFIEFVFPDGDLYTEVNQFNINDNFKKEIYSWISFKLTDKESESRKNPIYLGEGYLPINYLLIRENLIPQNLIKIAIRNVSEDLTIGYLNLKLIKSESDVINSNTLELNTAMQKIYNFQLTDNIQELNDIDPLYLQENFKDFHYFEKNRNNLNYLKFAQSNIKVAQQMYSCLEKGNLSDIQELLARDNQDKIYDDMKIHNQFNYYTFLYICNELLSNLKGLEKSIKSEIILERLKTEKYNFFNITFFELNLEEGNKMNLLILNIYITIFVKLKKRKLIENYAEQYLKESYSFKNIIDIFGGKYIKIVNRISKINSSKLKVYELEHILLINFQKKYLFLVNMIIQDYLALGIEHDVDKQNLFLAHKTFLLEETEQLKLIINIHLVKNSSLFLNDENYIIIVMKILLNYIKFLKLMCYSNRFSHMDFYIDPYIFKDKSIIIWILTILYDYILNKRFYILFIEFIYELIQELNGVYLFEFKKYFDLCLFTMSFIPYMKQLNKNSILIWFFMSDIFKKFCLYSRCETLQNFDFLSNSDKDVKILIETQFNMILYISRDEYFNFSSLKFQEIVYSNSYYLIITSKKKSKFLLSKFHLKIFINIIDCLILVSSHAQLFLKYINTYAANYAILLQYIFIFVLINFESVPRMLDFFDKNKSSLCLLYYKILKIVKFFCSNSFTHSVFFLEMENFLIKVVPSMNDKLLKFDILWENYRENLKIKFYKCLSEKDSTNSDVYDKLEQEFTELDNIYNSTNRINLLETRT